MITAKTVKDIASLVGAVAGIATGIDKTRIIALKWVGEYKERRNDKQSTKRAAEAESDEQ